MIISMRLNASKKEVDEVRARIEEYEGRQLSRA